MLKRPAAKKRPAVAPAALRRPAAAAAKRQRAVARRPAAAETSKSPAAEKVLDPCVECTDRAGLAEVASRAKDTYHDRCAFPEWSLRMLEHGFLEKYQKTVVAYHAPEEEFRKVRQMARQREPANIMLQRLYDEDAFEAYFGYRHGAYGESDEASLMPNIAIFCRTPMKKGWTGPDLEVNVINVVGFGFDHEDQPDYKYFMPLHENPAKWGELVQKMQQMWRYIYECAKRHQFKRVYLADIGGGNFGAALARHADTSYARLKEESLLPVQEEYADCVESHQLQRIPDWCFSEEGRPLLEDSLLVNAWDPWCLVGNANEGDNSLDGFFGRCTAMALLCWETTNPYMRYEKVEAKAS